MSDDLNKLPPPVPQGDPRRTTGRYGGASPAEKETVQTAAIPGPLAAVLAEIQESVREGFVRINANIDATHEAVDGLRDRVGRLEEAAAKRQTGPQKTYSGQIKGLADEVGKVSGNDHTQDAAIAQLLTRQAATEAKVDSLVTSQGEQTKKLVDIGTAVTGWAKEHPTLVNGAVALLTAAMLWATSWLNSRGH